MKTFFQSFLGAFAALIIFCVLGMFIFAGIASVLTTKEKSAVSEKSVLVIDLGMPYRELQPSNPFAEIINNPDNEIPSLYELIRLVRHAKTDAAIRGIYIKSNISTNGFAASEELRNELEDFRKNKKFVIAYGDYTMQGAYYIASVADKVYCNPQGIFQWKGMSVQLAFIKNTLQKLEIEPQIFYAGKFKSATEPLREEKMTEANRLQTTVLLEDIFGNVLSAVAKSRGLDTATLRRLSDDMSIQTVEDAVKYKLIDGAKYDDQVKEEIRVLNGLKKDEKINFITPGRYADAVDYKMNASKNRIAVIYAEGEIVYGKGEEGQIASDDFRKLISKIRTDDN
jgi:protease-4